MMRDMVEMVVMMVMVGMVGSMVVDEVGGKECEDSELQAMQTDFNTCANKKLYTFEDERIPEKEEDQLCTLITGTVSECAKIWDECHNTLEVRRMQDTQLEALSLQYSEVASSSCPVVVEYMDSGRQEENRAGMRCSDGESFDAQRKFGDCSHGISGRTYSTLSEHEEYDEEEYEERIETEEEKTEEDKAAERLKVSEVLCEALREIGTTCMKELQKCFRREDVMSTTLSHLNGMKGYFITIAGDQARPDSLDSCDPSKTIDFGPEDKDDLTEEYMEDYDEEEMSNDARNEIQAAIEKELHANENGKKEKNKNVIKELSEPKRLQTAPESLSSSSSSIIVISIFSILTISRMI